MNKANAIKTKPDENSKFVNSLGNKSLVAFLSVSICTDFCPDTKEQYLFPALVMYLVPLNSRVQKFIKDENKI